MSRFDCMKKLVLGYTKIDCNFLNIYTHMSMYLICCTDHICLISEINVPYP